MTEREKLEQRLGQLTYKIAKLQEELRKCQIEANEVATEIEKLDG
jgi:septal ring factor EnvC (AmiA/AmiB activator)